MPNPLLALVWAGLATVLTLLLFRPENGLFWRWQRVRQLTERVLSEDALKHLHKCELRNDRATLVSVTGALGVSGNQAAALLARMADHGLLQVDGNAFELTARGRDSALHILRAHRLWERYLAEETGYVEAEWHDRAERHEHHISTDDADNLSVHLGNPTHDPHGDPIPTAGGAFVYHGGRPLSNHAPGERLHVVHLEDEPEAVYAQLVALGLHPGMEVQLLESGSMRIRLWAAGDEHVIAPVLAANISVLPVIAPERADADEGEPLADLHHGQSGRVLGISRKCRGLERRRLLDLGVLPGTVITAEMRSPSGDPTAYRIRDAVIGLRAEQAGMINVAPI